MSYTRNNVIVEQGLNHAVTHNGLEAKQIKAAASIVNKAIKYLDSAHKRSTGNFTGDALKYGRRYFLFPPTGPTPTQKSILLSILIMTRNGIAADRKIVVEERGIGGDGIQGWTNTVAIPFAQIAAAKQQFPTRMFHYSTGSGDYSMMGDINLSESVMDSERIATVTYIHEATHRYANTLDFDPKGYTTDGVTYNGPGLTTTEALLNADSYAWYAFKVGR